MTPPSPDALMERPNQSSVAPSEGVNLAASAYESGAPGFVRRARTGAAPVREGLPLTVSTGAPTARISASSLNATAWPYDAPAGPVSFCDSLASTHPAAGLRNVYTAPRSELICTSGAPTAIVAPSPLIATAVP